MEGQYTIFDFYVECLEKNIKEKYQIPKLDQKFISSEGWWDDWHYTELETPEDDIYYTITDLVDHWFYSYKAFQNGKWYHWSRWQKKWLPETYTPFAWVGIPSLYMKQDETLREMLNL